MSFGRLNMTKVGERSSRSTGPTRIERRRMFVELVETFFRELISSVEASLASPSAVPVSEKGSRTSKKVASGSSSPALSKNLNLNGSSSRTSPRVKVAGCVRCGPHCKMLDTVRPQSRFLPPMSVHLTSGDGSSSLDGVLWPTTTTSDARGSGAQGYETGHSGTTLTDAAVRWASPMAMDGRTKGSSSRRKGQGRSTDLPTEVRWATPMARDGVQGIPPDRRRNGSEDRNLPREALWPTATAYGSNAGGANPEGQMRPSWILW